MALFGKKNKETNSGSELKITVKNEGNVYTFLPEGRLDTLTSPSLEAKLNEVVGGAEKLIFDLGGLLYISSAGLRVLLGAVQQMEGKGEMIVRNLSPEVRDVFDLTGFSRLFTIEIRYSPEDRGVCLHGEKSMTNQEIINGLYRELLFIAVILIGILFINNIVLYKQKLKDRISVMLLTAVALGCFEILWSFCEGHPEWKALTYIGACGYMILFVIFTVLLNRYILFRFDRLPKSRWLTILFYIAPPVIFSILCITTPWTHWFVRVDEAGVLYEEVLFDALFTPLMILYVLIAVISAVRCAIKGRRGDHATTRIAYNMIVFGVLIPAIYIMEILLLDVDSKYLALNFAVSIAMVYLTTNVSTHTLLETRAKVEATEADLRIGTEIQASMLPSIFPPFPDRPEFDIHASMDPAKEVGGDFYDFFMIDEDHLALVIADVSGKGIPAALFMMSTKIIINDHATMGGSPAEILDRVNKLVCANNKAHMFVTVWLGILEISTGKLTTASAGLEYPIINVNGRYELMKDKHGLAVGAMAGSQYFNTEITLHPGDSIFVYTDGVAEATDANNRLFGTDRTVEALNAIPAGASQKEVLAGVRAAVDAFVKEAPQFDDLTMLGLRYNGPADPPGEGDRL